ncbi:uncharacterized protein LOC110703057 [Chenopodium quinoa]|uniref:uncharacterized protein LOC110703057 n=1 Tax=Chenopodium quinoa TaxID=63459 RepID=UPI000B7947E1|nr:uncharacterized protein LOC110703057 [Chenopodium quinoa]
MADDLVKKCSTLRLDDDEGGLIDLGEVDCADSNENFDLLLIGRLCTSRPYNVEAFKRTMMKDKEKIMKGMPWCWEKNLLVLNEIEGNEQPDCVDLTRSPFWIRVLNLPFNCRSDAYVKTLTATLGEFLDIKEDTLRLGRYRRIRLLMNVEKPLRRYQWVRDKKGDEVRIEFKYERLPYFCFACGIIGHSEKDCTLVSEEDRAKKLGWRLFLRASPRKGVQKHIDEYNQIASSRKKLFVTKENDLNDASLVLTTKKIAEDEIVNDSLAEKGVNDTESEQANFSKTGAQVLSILDNACVGTRGVLSENAGEVVKKGEIRSEGKIGEGRVNEGETRGAAKLSAFVFGVSEGPGSKKGWKRVSRVVREGNMEVDEGGELANGVVQERGIEDVEGLVTEDSEGVRKRNKSSSQTPTSTNHICGDMNNGDKRWRFVGIYGWPEESNKHQTWRLIHHLCEGADCPIVLGGDFNEILSSEEIEGGADRERREMQSFRDVMDLCELRDLGYKGQWWTWERGRTVRTRVRERLDRFIVSSTWARIFPRASVEHLLKYFSDHAPIVLRLVPKARKRRKLDESCEAEVKKVWQAANEHDVIGKLGQDRVSAESCERSVELENRLDDLQRKHEAYWFLRSRVLEVRDGDKNTSYYHHKASQRRKRNTIEGLYDSDGVWQEDDELFENIVSGLYTNLFTSTNPTNEQTDKVLQHVKPIILDSNNAALLRPYTKEEVYDALKQMHPCKAPGPDGMHAIFYQKFWHIVGDDVYHFVSNILRGVSPLNHVNKTNISLIPKVKSPTSMSEFRPISLCNVLYKLVSKVIVLRLKSILPNVVTENQSAFVPGRLITDNALIALELFHTMKNRSQSRKGSIALKLDMSKAYDRVEWGFLRKLLLTMDAFSHMLHNKVHQGELHGVKASRSGPAISHLLFADDSLLFARATRQECEVIVDILNRYEVASGLKINFEKSEVSFSRGVSTEQQEELMGILKMRTVDRHSKYLGIPTIVGRSKKAIFGALLDRIWKKLQGWKEKLLSRVGKEILLKSVIQAIPTYLMGVYKFPSSVIQSIRSAMAKFFWGSGARRKIHWKSWDVMCTPKCVGGMGFKDLEVFNIALLGKQAWRLVWKDESLLGRVMSAKYYPNSSFLDSYLGVSRSFSWRRIWSAKALLKEGLIWRIGNGSTVNIWKDPWVADENGMYITSAAVEGLNNVNELVDFSKMEWGEDLISSVFNERDTKCILSIPLGAQTSKDVITWAFSNDVMYSTKTSYMLGKGCNFDLLHKAWAELWGLEASPKVSHFLWRMCSPSLSVGECRSYGRIWAALVPSRKMQKRCVSC